MKIEVRGPTFSGSDALRAHAQRRRRRARALRRAGDAGHRPSDRPERPRGGVDKRCHVSLRVRRGGRTHAIELDERSHDAYAALDGAADRVGRPVPRGMDRARP